MPAGAFHGINIQRHRYMGAVIAQQGAGMAAVIDQVAVLFARGVKAGVKTPVHFPPRRHADIARQPGVQGKGNLVGWDS
ncbi:hypothetical protein SDC9_163321 [bioreactor metagenome]|uniref:Uncharacterized protein n=1 Tax=bioreactor metagenome TaxID=1076179 RepID=A0A645FNI9_9ZZZZ